jgi:two-component system, NtrC family, sensor kinase
MKYVTFFYLILLFFGHDCQSQSSVERDSFLRLLSAHPAHKQDSSLVKIKNELAYQYHFIKPDSTLILGKQSLELARKIKYTDGEIVALMEIGGGYGQFGDYGNKKIYLDQAKDLASKTNNSIRLAAIMNNIGAYFEEQGNFELALSMHIDILNSFPGAPLEDKAVFNANLGNAYLNLAMLDSAAFYLNKALPLAVQYYEYLVPFIYRQLGVISKMRFKTEEALAYLQKCVGLYTKHENYSDLSYALKYMSELYHQKKNLDSTIHYAKLALAASQKASFTSQILWSSRFLSDLYKGKNDSEALRYLELAILAKDSLFSQDKVQRLLKYNYEEKLNEQERDAAISAYRNSIRSYVFLSLFCIFGAITIFLYRNNKQKLKANRKLQVQKDQIQDSMAKLKSTQAQLIQSEKMASLGELTAGIAHEIQNPLNFVNNFSELSVDLAKELKEEVEKLEIPEKEKVYVVEIIGDLSQNQEKINHHGKRASDIVKGMLEHSRKSTGEKEATDINVLCDEYLRLAYQSMKAKNSDFTTTMETHFDPNLPQIDIIPQDIGRVLLNLINNAFYAVNERSKKDESNYVPTVSVTTEVTANSQLQISVKDNGSGIPDAIKEKIFQPFFTTKPTGQGTGLGLSLSYDIVKAHGGEIKVSTKEYQGTAFTILLNI